MTAIKQKTPAWPVVEIFGPTLQGEGVDQGAVAHFVRFGGCDFRCDWCDTPYAVLPEQVRANARKMTATGIRYELLKLDETTVRERAPWVVLTGGNPALHDLSTLIEELHNYGFLVAVETQGSRWREWMADVDRLCVSPKPPSAKEPKSRDTVQLQRFLHEGMLAKINGERPYEWIFLKVVCFTLEDLDYAEQIRDLFSDAILYLSAGNDAGATVGNPDRKDTRGIARVRADLLDKTAWLADQVFKRPTLCAPDVYVQHQLHTAMWGNGRGF